MEVTKSGVDLPGIRPPDTFYHGTSIECAMQIQAFAFDVSRSGTSSGHLLGRGVYCTTVLDEANDYAKGKPYGGVVLQLRCNLSVCKKIVVNDPMMTTWQLHGFDSAWLPKGANRRNMSENCIKDPAHISIVQIMVGDTSHLRRLGMIVREIDGRIAMVGDGGMKRKRCTDDIDAAFLHLLLSWNLEED